MFYQSPNQLANVSFNFKTQVLCLKQFFAFPTVAIYWNLIIIPNFCDDHSPNTPSTGLSFSNTLLMSIYSVFGTLITSVCIF